MIGPEADRGDSEEDMLAWFEIPRAGEAECYAEGVAGEDLNLGLGTATTDAAVDEGA